MHFIYILFFIWNYHISWFDQIFQRSSAITWTALWFITFTLFLIVRCVGWACEFRDGHIVTILVFSTLIEHVAVFWILSERTWAHINCLIRICVWTRWVSSLWRWATRCRWLLRCALYRIKPINHVIFLMDSMGHNSILPVVLCVVDSVVAAKSQDYSIKIRQVFNKMDRFDSINQNHCNFVRTKNFVRLNDFSFN